MTGGVCLFCKILEGDMPGSFVYRDDRVSALMDISPINAGHVLVIPRTHSAHLADLDPADGAAMFRAGQRIAAAVRKAAPRCDAVNLWLADGAVAGQEVFHAHLHVIPRFAGDGFDFEFPPHYGEGGSRVELDELAQRIHEALD